jgi:hypothetical protein
MNKYKCDICKDDGHCLNSPSNKDYEMNNKDVWLDTDIYDCTDYYNQYVEGRPKGSWMKDWLIRLKKVSPIIILLLTSCVKIVEVEEPSYYLTLDMRLDRDENGYYHMLIDGSNHQTLHRISGKITDQNGTPVEFYWIEWGSGNYWIYDGFQIPITNKISYTNSDGIFNNMIGVVPSLRGDTVSIYYETSDHYGSREIILH